MHCNHVQIRFGVTVSEITLECKSEIVKKKHSFIIVTESSCNIKYVPVDVGQVFDLIV